MHVKPIIDDVLQNHDGVDPTDAAATPRINKLLFFLQDVNDYVHNYREWEWTFTEGNVTIPTNQNYGAYPTNFMEFGRNGGLWDPSRHIRLHEESRYRIERYRNETLVSLASAQVFGNWGGQIQLPFTNTGGTITYLAFYRQAPDILIYDNSTVLQMPDKYRYLIMTRGLVARAQQSKQDARGDWRDSLINGLSLMCATENPRKTSLQKFPASVRGAW